MTKTPDEIKKGLECCARGDCHSCPYVDNCILSTADALALIRQLQAQNAEKDARIRQLEAERDAAVETLTKISQKHDESFCEYCDNWDRYTCPPSCRTYCERFKWRSVQKEDAHEQ